MEIAQPAQLSKLPRAGLTGDGRSRFCQVFAFQAGHRKKRQEICAAVDGNSVNILEVVNGRNIASWPVPPDVTFVSEPCSLRTKSKDGSHCRRTWCVIRRRQQTSVECYEEIKDNKNTTHSISSCSIKASTAGVVTIQPIGLDAVAVIQDDGRATLVSYGKGSPKDEYLLQSTPGISKILTAQVLTIDAAHLSILRSRSDLISGLAQNSVIIVVVYTTLDSAENKLATVQLGIWALSGSRNTTSDSTLSPLVSYEIECSAIKTASRRARLDHDVRRLEVSDKTSTIVFDLTTTLPQQTAVRKSIMNDAISETELANNIYFSFSSDKFLLYNASFNSVLASSPRSKNELKRKRNAGSSTDLSVIAYFSQLKRIVAEDNHWIYAIDIHAEADSSRPFQKGSLLIGNILRGTSRTSTAPSSTTQPDLRIGGVEPEQLPNNWQTLRKELDTLAAEKDAPGFEQKFLKVFGQTSFSKISRDTVPKRVTEYVLNKVFGFDSDSASAKDGSRCVKVAFFTPNLLKWLIESGFVEDSRVFRALQVGNVISSSDSESVARSLLDVEDNLQIMQHYINKSPHIDATQLCGIIKSLLTTALAQSNRYMQKKLRHELKVEMDEAADSQAIAIGVGPDELTVSTVTTTCLSHALQRLALSGHATVSHQFRKWFNQHETLALIQFLRQQLFLGGYTRLVENSKPLDASDSIATSAEKQKTNPNPQITLEALVMLLNGCVDALGPVGILGSDEHEEFIQDLLPDLLSEITNATTAIEDSTFLQGLLRETLRYAESVERQPFEVRLRIQKESARFDKKGEVVTLYAEPDAEEAGMIAGSALPLGLKAAEDINRYKVRKGGGQIQKRSVREMGMLKDRLRSSYAFERLVL